MKKVMKCGINNMEEKVRQIIENVLHISREDYKNTDRFEKDLECDSLDIIDLVIQCEIGFNISVPDDEVVKIITVQDLIDCVSKHCN